VALPPLGSIHTTDPDAVMRILAAAAAARTLDGRPPTGLVARGLAENAAQHAPGMKAVAAFSGYLAQGDDAVFLVTLAPAKCYTIVGFSAETEVTEVDLRLLSPPFYNGLAAESVTASHAPVLGSAPDRLCSNFAVALQYKLDVHAARGAGTVGVTVLEVDAPKPAPDAGPAPLAP
jgi:hypothetical protein